MTAPMLTRPCDHDLDLLAVIWAFERVQKALAEGHEEAALGLMHDPSLRDDVTRLYDHVSERTWTWVHGVACDVPGDMSAWLGYVSGELERLRGKPRRRWLPRLHGGTP